MLGCANDGVGFLSLTTEAVSSEQQKQLLVTGSVKEQCFNQDEKKIGKHLEITALLATAQF